eukprot:CAMPEP_0201523664 /NCGR_PEP_ID=MMETSP0161_2-20130828/20712_1 /ASSEMBLY_ACC=CAM_ASM_000251 /TAXON_ID=180227 /ORGANISM="Neoparamoeba aestuarina, Strain SoJaBio B1-5/56/2" /LENGTH=136 /DNA_ID=CAMNT_0047922849 /DNA_START=1 /DNA_END=411 /DNA_ORIENTATION=+
MRMRFYGERVFTPTHEWIDKETGECGITKYALSKGEVVYLEMPEAGSVVQTGDEIGEVASVKSSSALIVPVGGTVTEVNSELEEDLTTLNAGANAESQSDSAWIYKLSPSDPLEFSDLMGEDEYGQFAAKLEDEES